MARLAVLYIDALAADYVDPEVTPNLAEWWDEGGTRLTPLFAFKGVGASMFTGQPPSETGVWSDFRIRREIDEDRTGSTLHKLARLVPGDLPRKAAVTAYERVLEGAHVTAHEVPAHVRAHLEPAMTSAVSEPGAVPGCPTVFDRLRAGDREVHLRGMDGGLQDRLVASLPEVAGRAEDLAMVKVNLLDHLGHARGPGSPEAEEALGRLDRRIGEAVEAHPDKAVLVISDHGMTAVEGSVDLRGELRDRLDGLEEGADYVPYYNSTSAYFRWRDPGVAEAAREAIEAVEGVGFLSEEERADLGIEGVVPAYGDDVAATDPGIVISPDFYRDEVPAGMHGFATSDQEEAVLVAPGRSTREQGRMWDVGPTILDALGVEPGEDLAGESLLGA